MAFVNNFLGGLAAAAPELSNWIGKLIYLLYENIGSFGWTVVIFTIILKTILLPLDIWQRNLVRKNNNAMKRMKPKLEKLQKQYGNDKMAYNQKQMELYKKEGYSMLGSCLPMLITMVIFFVVFAGFRGVVRYQNEYVVYELVESYNEMNLNGNTEDEINTELVRIYETKMEGWLWIDNVFMPDSWSDVVPSKSVYEGKGMGQLGATMPENMNFYGDYDTLIKPIAENYNKSSFWDIKNWNGFLILPLLSLFLNIVTQKFSKPMTPEMPTAGQDETQVKSQQATMKMMMYTMPIMMVVFAVLYSSAFTIYMFFSSLYGVAFQIIFTYITKRIDQRKEEERLKTTFKY